MPSNQFTRVEKLVGECEDWTEVTTFSNGFLNVGGLEETAGFYKDPFNVVHLKGRVDTGTANTIMFTLPEGYRPPKRIQLPGLYSGIAFMQINIEVNGDVLTQGAGGTGSTNIQGISFRV